MREGLKAGVVRVVREVGECSGAMGPVEMGGRYSGLYTTLLGLAQVCVAAHSCDGILCYDLRAEVTWCDELLLMCFVAVSACVCHVAELTTSASYVPHSHQWLLPGPLLPRRRR